MNLKTLTSLLVLALVGILGCTSSTPNSRTDSSLDSNVIQSDQEGLIIEVLHQRLDKKVDETSGLEKIGDRYWTHNDSGGEPEIYNIDIQSGLVISTEKIIDATNKDWEDITADDTHVYIGDFGNNRGGRKDLTVYKIPKSNLNQEKDVASKSIIFSYPDQTKYYSGYNHNFDCEAMINQGDSLYLFSKNWLDKRCKLYALSKNNTNQKATLISEFDSEGTITGASIDVDSKSLYLIGYVPGDGFQSFMWVIKDWEGNNFLSGDRIRYDLNLPRQTEAIQVVSNNTVIISAESDNSGYPALYKIVVPE